jgi:cold shock CspA family protein
MSDEQIEFGIVRAWRSRSWGFVEPVNRQRQPTGERDVFMHHSDLLDDIRDRLRQGVMVTFSRGTDDKGRT